jgi:hypothetical protein
VSQSGWSPQCMAMDPRLTRKGHQRSKSDPAQYALGGLIWLHRRAKAQVPFCVSDPQVAGRTCSFSRTSPTGPFHSLYLHSLNGAHTFASNDVGVLQPEGNQEPFRWGSTLPMRSACGGQRRTFNVLQKRRRVYDEWHVLSKV